MQSSIHRLARAIMVLAAVALVAACATPAVVKPPAIDSAAPQAAAIVTLQGRLSVTVQSEPVQAFHASFALSFSRAAHTGQLRLFSPLGQTLGELQWSPDGARVLQGGKTQTYSSVEAMLQAQTGAALPLDALLDWLEGRATPSPGWQVDVSRHADGRINANRSDPQPPVQLRVILEAP